MTGTQTAVTVATAILLTIAALRAVHRQRSTGRSDRERAREALRQLNRDRRRRSGVRQRGTGDHFWRTKVNKWDADRPWTNETDGTGGPGGGYGDSGGGGGYGDSGGGGSSW
ncbi:hypothetical protein V6U90_26190 [Micromonospora sp. CPCC 206060]|uniref:hypothetical protein n=1 Tax=Micromonospora sp. CPCC 206060 TaxID=3122406 RepID=UPI002FF18E3B